MDDTKLLHRIRSLLAKAESTDFQEEALALTAKAHELMAAHAIDQAMLTDEDRSTVKTAIITIEAPYAKHKYLLLSAAARANGCQAILGIEWKHRTRLLADGSLRPDSNDRLCTVVGFDADIVLTEMLFTSLLIQAGRVMLQRPDHVDSLQAYRRAFLVGFARAVNGRLREVRSTVAAQAEATTPGVLPVLASRDDQVAGEVEKRFPKLGSLSLSVSNGTGYMAGHSAGERADLGTAKLRPTPALKR